MDARQLLRGLADVHVPHGEHRSELDLCKVSMQRLAVRFVLYSCIGFLGFLVRLRCASDLVGSCQFEYLIPVYHLFDGPSCDQAIHCHILVLADAMDSVHRLAIHCWVPMGIHYDHTSRAGQRQTDASYLGSQQTHFRLVCAVIELGDNFSTSVRCDAAVNAGVDDTVGEEQLAQHVQHTARLGEDECFVAFAAMPSDEVEADGNLRAIQQRAKLLEFFIDLRGTHKRCPEVGRRKVQPRMVAQLLQCQQENQRLLDIYLTKRLLNTFRLQELSILLTLDLRKRYPNDNVCLLGGQQILEVLLLAAQNVVRNSLVQ